MAKRTSRKYSAAPVDEADPRFVPVAKAFADTAGFSLMESTTGAMRGLMMNGKSFGMSSNGRFILKLNEERASALIAEGVGEPFSPAEGRVMKGWIVVTSPSADWVALAKEAQRLAAAEKKTPGLTTAKR
jgi:hypothetical protein